jgi:phytanoyl-CoA hydroxylase
MQNSLTEVAAALFGEGAVPREFQWFNKPPRIGKATPPHQDGYYFMLQPNLAMTMWLALDSVDERNGCVRYIPGSHKLPIRPHKRTGTLGFSQGVSYEPSDFDAEIAVSAEPGDMLVHHSLTVHRADANRSDRHRRSLGIVFYAQSAKVDTERHKAYNDALKRELAETGKI